MYTLFEAAALHVQLKLFYVATVTILLDVLAYQSGECTPESSTSCCSENYNEMIFIKVLMQRQCPKLYSCR